MGSLLQPIQWAFVKEKEQTEEKLEKGRINE